jgi:hypothetical protein
MNVLLSNPLIVVMLAVAALCLGFLFGFLLKGLLKPRSQEQAESVVPAAGPANPNWEEVAHLWRDRRDRRLIFQIEDEFYKRGNHLTTKEKKILLKVVMDFYQWLEPTSKIDPPQPEPPTAPAHSPVIPENGTENLPAPVPGADKPETKTKRPSFSPVRIITQALEADVAASAIPPQSMAVQIDDILQEKLTESDMQNWAVRLIEFPNRGMVVMVGLEQYEEIDKVPYERVRQTIREAVAEWERRSERKRSE